MTEHWEVVMYYTGMTPVTHCHDTEAAALAEWDRIKDDPWQGASCVRYVKILRSA